MDPYEFAAFISIVRFPFNVSLRHALIVLTILLFTASALRTFADDLKPSLSGDETIICVRHGEKPPQGLGQLAPQGLRRALALPDVLLKKFGTPQYIFAPNPTQMVNDAGGNYYYVRPLATIEPTAIRCSLPVDTQFGYKEIDGLETELKQPKYEHAVIFVAWEHGYLERFARQFVKDLGGNAASVPGWGGNDYDSIYIIRVADGKIISFAVDHEGLDHVGATSAAPSPKAP